MSVEESKGWRIATAVAIVIWIVFAVRLMIADVWDETNGMLAFSAASPLLPKLQFVLTQSLGFWRPLPTLVVTLVLHVVRDFDVSWRILRGLNMAMLLASLALMLRHVASGTSRPDENPRTPDARSPFHGSAPLRFALTIAFLFSGSAIITAGWYANIFDASALLLVMVGLTLLLRGKDLAAGVILGVAFFCKESAALALPFLVVLFAAERITFKQALRAGIPATILGAIYFAIRSKIVPFGGEGDIHGFAPEQLVPTIVHLGGSLWLQMLKGWLPLGFLALALFFIALRKPRVIAATLLFLAATTIIYWGMFGITQDGVLLHHLNFVGRLYLVPVTLLLVLLALERRTLAIAALCVPIVLGATLTYRDHARFQRTYKRIYRTASEAQQKPLLVHYPTKPLEDNVRGIRIGDFPEAGVKVDAKTGRVTF
jgi:hypothetical protein